MTREQWSALLSVVAAMVIAVATYFQWVTISYEGRAPLRGWVKYFLLPGVLILLGVAALLLMISAGTTT